MPKGKTFKAVIKRIKQNPHSEHKKSAALFQSELLSPSDIKSGAGQQTPKKVSLGPEDRKKLDFEGGEEEEQFPEFDEAQNPSARSETESSDSVEDDGEHDHSTDTAGGSKSSLSWKTPEIDE